MAAWKPPGKTREARRTTSRVLSYDRIMKTAVVHLPEELKADLERVAQSEGRTEEDLIVEGVRHVIELRASPSPRIPLFSSGDPTLAERTEEHLKGFGER